MSIENCDIVDSIGIINESIASLLITDHLNWENEKEHMLLLQNKINKYLSFIESGEVYSTYPLAKEKKFEIRVYAKYTLTKNAEQFMHRMKILLEKAGYFFIWERL
jgi:hypothetical protein